MFKHALAVFVATVSAANGPGIAFSLSQEGLATAKNIATPYIFKIVKDVKIKDIPFQGGDFSNVDIQLPAPDTKDVVLKNIPEENGIELDAMKLNSTITADFTFKYIISVKGKAEIHVKNLGIDFAVDMSTQPGTPAYELAPKLDAKTVKVTLSPDDIDIKLTGSLVSKIANVLIPLIKSTVIPNLITQVEAEVKKGIDTTADDDLHKYGSQVTIPYLAGATFDFAQMNGGPTVTNAGEFTIAVNGTWFNTQKPAVSKLAPAKFDPADLKGKMLQAYLTDYSINTMLQAGFDSGNTLDVGFLLKKLLNITLTTDQMAYFVPEIATKYGKGVPVDLQVAFVKAPSTLNFLTGAAEGALNFKVMNKIKNEDALTFSFTDGGMHLTASSKDDLVYLDIQKFMLGTLGSDFKTTLGLTGDAFTKEVQGKIDSLVTLVNSLLSKGYKIPKIFNIDITGGDIDLTPGLLAAGAVVANPGFFKQVAYLMGVFAEECQQIKLMMGAPWLFMNDPNFQVPNHQPLLLSMLEFTN